MNEEREQTLNQLLSELDGFDAREDDDDHSWDDDDDQDDDDDDGDGDGDVGGRANGDANGSSTRSSGHHSNKTSNKPPKTVIIVAATNRVQLLDPALTRPGRFDRIVRVPLPDAAGREAILRVHCRRRRIKTSRRALDSLASVALRCEGFSGADLENVVNEAAIAAVRARSARVGPEHLVAAANVARAAKGLPRWSGAQGVGVGDVPPPAYLQPFLNALSGAGEHVGGEESKEAIIDDAVD